MDSFSKLLALSVNDTSARPIMKNFHVVNSKNSTMRDYPKAKKKKNEKNKITVGNKNYYNRQLYIIASHN